MINGAEIISMSLSAMNESDLGDYNGQTAHIIIQEAVNMGILLVAATGNWASYYPDQISYPAAFPEVIAVGSTDEYDYKANSSQYSTEVDIMAPGHLVYSTIQESPWYQGGWSGTSFATPTVAGALALMKSFQPTATVEQLKYCLYNGADNIDNLNQSYVGKLGSGRLNVYKSMHCIDSLFTTNEAPICIVTSPQNGQMFTQGDEVLFSVSATDTDGVIDSVVFVLDTTAFATYTVAPYQYNLITDINTPTGTYSFYAIAYDNNSAFSYSDTVTITLNHLSTLIYESDIENIFNIYPNPASTYVIIESEKLKGEGLQILDISGKVVKHFKINNSEFRIQIEDLDNGVYFIKIGTQVQKFIKK